MPFLFLKHPRHIHCHTIPVCIQRIAAKMARDPAMWMPLGQNLILAQDTHTAIADGCRTRGICNRAHPLCENPIGQMPWELLPLALQFDL
jgi:hypothetical protein